MSTRIAAGRWNRCSDMNPRDLARLLDTTVTRRVHAGVDRSGNPTTPTDTVIPARVERKQRRVITGLASAADGRYGEEVLSDTTVVTNTRVDPTDELQLPGESKWRSVLSVEYAGSPDRRGASVWQVMV